MKGILESLCNQKRQHNKPVMAIVLPRQGMTFHMEYVNDLDKTEFLAYTKYCGGQHLFKEKLIQFHPRVETVCQRRFGHMIQDIYFR